MDKQVKDGIIATLEKALAEVRGFRTTVGGFVVADENGHTPIRASDRGYAYTGDRIALVTLDTAKLIASDLNDQLKRKLCVLTVRPAAAWKADRIAALTDMIATIKEG